MEEKINALINHLAFVENRDLKRMILENFIKQYGEIPDEYKDAVNAVMEL